MFSAHSHSHLLPGFEIREYVTPSLLKERVHLLPRKNNYLEPCLSCLECAYIYLDGIVKLISPLLVFTLEGTIGLPSVHLLVHLSAKNLDPLITIKLLKLGV